MEVLAAPGQQAFDPWLPPVAWSGPAAETGHARVGWFDDNGLFPPSPEIRGAVHEASEILTRKGGGVVWIAPPDSERTNDLFEPCDGHTEMSAS